MKTYIKEISETLQQIKTNHERLDRIAYSTETCIAYFTHTLSLAAYNDDDHMIIGHFHMKNIGNTSITEPVFYLQINSDATFEFSGKYAPREGLGNSTIHEWERIQSESHSDGEYYFKPLQDSDVPQGESLLFPDFQLRVPATGTLHLSVQGIVYCKENEEGINALNMINITL